MKREHALRKQEQALKEEAAADRQRLSQIKREQALLERQGRGATRSRPDRPASGLLGQRRSTALPSPWERRRESRRLGDELRKVERDLRSATEARRSILFRLRQRRY